MNEPRVLVVDDDLSIRRLLRATLERSGYAVVEAMDARGALDQAADADAILLDLGLPDRDGLELVPLLKQRTSAPVIVISAREGTDDKVAALDLGAHDYVTKPFDSEEVLARLRASFRSKLAAQGTRPVVHAGDVHIDLTSRRILRGEEEVHLTRKEFGVLSELAKAPGRVVTHDAILRSVWPHEHDRHVEYLRIVVRNLRQKLELQPSSPSLIVNELGVGYRLMVEI